MQVGYQRLYQTEFVHLCALDATRSRRRSLEASGAFMAAINGIRTFWSLTLGPRYYCDYCGTYLTHDSAPGRRQHNRGERPPPHPKDGRLLPYCTCGCFVGVATRIPF